MFKIEELVKVTLGTLSNALNYGHLSGFSIDSRSIKKGDCFIAIKGNNFDGHNFIDEAIQKGASCIVSQVSCDLCHVSCDIPFILVQDTTRALGDIARFIRTKFDIPVIAISGSNGKTTAKEMVAWVLSKKFKVLKNEGTKNNHIGLPQTLLNLDASYDIAVLELGTNHFNEIDYLSNICLPNIGIITNIGPSHLEYFKNLQGVFKEKYSLINNLKKPSIGILNSDDALLRKKITGKAGPRPIFSFGINKKSDFLAQEIKLVRGELEFSVNSKCRINLKTPGLHNIYNCLAAVSVARLFGMSYDDIAERFSLFDFPQGRLKVMERDRIIFIDDTYNSNPASFKHALSALNSFQTCGRKIVVMGDMLELGDEKEELHKRAGEEAAKVCDIFITVGELARLSADVAKSQGISNTFSCCSCDEVKEILYKQILIRENDIILVKGSRSMKMEGVLR